MKVDIYKSDLVDWTYLIVPHGNDPTLINPAPAGVESVHLKWGNYETDNTVLESPHVQAQLSNQGYFVFI